MDFNITNDDNTDFDWEEVPEKYIAWWRRDNPATLTKMDLNLSSKEDLKLGLTKRFPNGMWEAARGETTPIKAEQLLHKPKWPEKANIYLVNWMDKRAILKVFPISAGIVELMDQQTGSLTSIEMVEPAEQLDCRLEAHAYHLLQDSGWVPEFHGVYQLSYPAADGSQRYHLALLIEYFNGVSLDKIEEPSQLPKPVRYRIITQILEALYSIFQAGVDHQSVYPRNILMGKGCVIKIIDFGNWVSNDYRHGDSCSNYMDRYAQVIYVQFQGYVHGLTLPQVKKLALGIFERC